MRSPKDSSNLSVEETFRIIHPPLALCAPLPPVQAPTAHLAAASRWAQTPATSSSCKSVVVWCRRAQVPCYLTHPNLPPFSPLTHLDISSALASGSVYRRNRQNLQPRENHSLFLFPEDAGVNAGPVPAALSLSLSLAHLARRLPPATHGTIESSWAWIVISPVLQNHKRRRGRQETLIL
jgi:hypothetical protein